VLFQGDFLVNGAGLEPATTGLKVRCSTKRQNDESNTGATGYEGGKEGKDIDRSADRSVLAVHEGQQNAPLNTIIEAFRSLPPDERRMLRDALLDLGDDEA
jgi:hypothetical protein